jgi:hypothetical protein
MPDLTACRSIPYPLESDPIDVAADMQAMAEAIDVDLCGLRTESESEWVYGGSFVTNVSGSVKVCFRKQNRTVDWSGTWTGQVMASNPLATAPYPVTPHGGLIWIGTAMYRKTGSHWQPGGNCYFETNTQLAFACSPGGGGVVAPTAPFTWGPNDQALWFIRYETAA